MESAAQTGEASASVRVAGCEFQVSLERVDRLVDAVQTFERDAQVVEHERLVGGMLDGRLRDVDHVPVVREGRPVGMVTRRNLLQLLFLKIDPRTGQKTS